MSTSEQLTEAQPVALGSLVIGVLFWLPLAFLVWYNWSGLLLLPGIKLASAWLTHVFPATFDGFAYTETGWTCGVLIAEGSRHGVASFALNPLLYSYGLPLLVALTMAAPLSGRRQALQLLVGVVLCSLVLSWGLVFDSLKTVLFELGQLPGSSVKPDISKELVALGYQLGSLIMPGIVPVVYWVLANRQLVATVVDPARERTG